MTIGQPPGVTGNRGTLTRSLVLQDSFAFRRLQAAGLIRRGLGDAAIASRVGLPAEGVAAVRTALVAARIGR